MGALSSARGLAFALVQSGQWRVEAVPRHLEISQRLVAKICRALSIPDVGGEPTEP